MSKHILIVDDDTSIAEILEYNLKSEDYKVEIATSAEEALEKKLDNFHLILLDVMMGGMSGFKMAEKIRKEGVLTPIIFLTAKDTENDMLTGFSVGGDDYIAKPFSIKEVIARVRAVLKRTEKDNEIDNEPNKLVYDNFVIDFNMKEISIDDEKIPLTKTEFELLSLLAKHPDKMLSRENIINQLWTDTPYVTERTVDVHITRIRKKLGKYASVISNKIGYGYRFDINEL
ncbi:MAG TPA: response regulator transcription factor [Bacteroidales bacterium]|nr:response regulator transcription factor [Bacteroidales bacterium]HON20259.1 response regulator transcription factor [Bacteroidales bacterium]HOR82809.1 response regulator transcription factor [Bacteroidales bacterium]HPJ91900.1 response regulator transcription factor [Bacteroidales bacterium]HQB20016.1 response regulator transcription factor [Bacteroidales bacterium]